MVGFGEAPRTYKLTCYEASEHDIDGFGGILQVDDTESKDGVSPDSKCKHDTDEDHKEMGQRWHSLQ